MSGGIVFIACIDAELLIYADDKPQILRLIVRKRPLTAYPFTINTVA